MIGIVFNKHKDPLDFSWESYALRASLCLFDEAVCVGPSIYTIVYEEYARNLPLESKVRTLAMNEKDDESRLKFEQCVRDLKFMRKRKHPKKHEIVLMKKLEKSINDLFELHIKDMLTAFKKHGLPQLAPFNAGDDACLHLWYVHSDLGEQNKEGRLSQVLCFEVNEDHDMIPDVFVFYDTLAHQVLKDHTLTPLAKLPNLNALEADKLQLVRNQLDSEREELTSLLPMMEADKHGKQYYTGTWNLEGVKAFAPRLQQSIDKVHEIDWSSKLYTNVRSELHVGNMDTLELWQLLRNHDFIPDDTWKILQQKHESGIHCPTTPIMTITSNVGTDGLTNLTSEETLVHKRKTLDLN